MSDAHPNTLLTMRQVMQIAGFKSRTTIYRHVRAGCMPQPCQVGLGRIRWRESDIAAWIAQLPTQH
jgi:prophage regulatory protein